MDEMHGHGCSLVIGRTISDAACGVRGKLDGPSGHGKGHPGKGWSGKQLQVCPGYAVASFRMSAYSCGRPR